MLHLFLSVVIAFTTPVYGADIIRDEPDTQTEAKGPDECDSCGARPSQVPDPLPVYQEDELIGRVEDVDRRERKEEAKPASSFNWGAVLALALGAGVGYLAYKAISNSNSGGGYEPYPPYATQYPTYRTYQPPWMPGGSPYYTHYYGNGGGYPPGIMPFNPGGGGGYPPAMIPVNTGYAGGGYQYPGSYNIPPSFYQGSYNPQLVGSPYYGQPTNLGPPPPILPMVASTASATASSPICPTNNFFGTSVPVYNTCTL